MEVKIVGVSGSPVRAGNTEALLEEALKAAREVEGVSTEVINLAGKNIKDCIQCNFCVRKQEEGKICTQKDDMIDIYPTMMAADGLLVATPVYFARLSGLLACFLDRLRAINEGKYYKRKMENKPGGALSVAWLRNTGLETSLLTIHFSFFALRMLPIGPGKDGSQWGATGLSSQGGTGKFDPQDKREVLKDEYGVRSARFLGRRVAELAKVLKAGQAVFKPTLV